MTVCIAAACDSGKVIVTATDGLLSLGSVVGDTMAAKIIWKGEWQFMYAGTPSNTAMILGEVDEIAQADDEALTRRNVQRTVRSAYMRVTSRLGSFNALLPFNMTIGEFKKRGLAALGEQWHAEISNQIRHATSQINEQLLVVGWGIAPASAMLYEIGPYGDQNHSYGGVAVIGSGSTVAQSSLLMFGQGRHRTLAETIFNVAMSKFASEKSVELDVGRKTAICVSRKAVEGGPYAFQSESLNDDEISELRKVWNEDVRPKMPLNGRLVANRIAQRLGGHEVSDMVETINAVIQSNRQ